MSELDTTQPLAALAPAGVAPTAASGGEQTTRRTARAATISGLKQGLGMGLAAITAIVVARILGATGYGYYAGGMAAFALALAFSELGFSIVLSREMARSPIESGTLMRSTVQVQLLWSALIAAGLAAAAVLSGIGPRGEVMLVMAPVVLVSGLSAARQVFIVTFTVGRLFVVDTLSSVLQSAGMLLAAALRIGLVAIAGASGFAMCVNQIVGTRLAWPLVNRAPANPAQRRSIVKMALPLGVASIIASLYFTIDQVILTWLVPAAALGHYAAAVKLLTLVVTIPGFIMQAGIPALSKASDSRDELSDVAGRLAHWIAASALPLCVGLVVFAKPVVQVVYGDAYLASVPLLRILMLAGTFSLAANVLGIVLSALSIVRPQLIFNTITLGVNVLGNILLVPRYGVMASAWLTVACEAIVVSYALLVVRDRVWLSRMIAAPARMLLATAGAAVVGLVLGGSPLLGVPAAVALFVVLVVALGAWPSDLTPARYRRA